MLPLFLLLAAASALLRGSKPKTRLLRRRDCSLKSSNEEIRRKEEEEWFTLSPPAAVEEEQEEQEEAEEETVIVMDRGLDMEALERLEAELAAGGAPAPLGRECGRGYRWRQDGSYVEVLVPLRSAVPLSDVALVIAASKLSLALHGTAHHDFPGIEGDLGGEVLPERSEWRVTEDPDEGPAIFLRLAKKRQSAGAIEMWREFLRGEEGGPTPQLSGRCAVTGARYEQFAENFEVQLDIPDEARYPHAP